MSYVVRRLALFVLLLQVAWFVIAALTNNFDGWGTHLCLAAWCLICFIGYGRELL